MPNQVLNHTNSQCNRDTKTLVSLYLHCVTLELGKNANLKDKYTHNTCQIYVKPHSKNTQITLESQIFDEKALR